MHRAATSDAHGGSCPRGARAQYMAATRRNLGGTRTTGERRTTVNCLYCGGTEKLGTDHVVPRTRGGRNIPENTVRACRRCNASKNARLPSEWRKDLPPKVYAIERRAVRLHPKIRPLWRVDKQTAIRLSSSLVERIDKIAERMPHPFRAITRSDVIRIFVIEGADRYEKKKL